MELSVDPTRSRRGVTAVYRWLKNKMATRVVPILGRNDTENTKNYRALGVLPSVLATSKKYKNKHRSILLCGGDDKNSVANCYYLKRLRQGERLLGRVVRLFAHPAGLAEEHGGVKHVAAVHASGAAGGLVRVQREEFSLGVHRSPRALQPALHSRKNMTPGISYDMFF